MNLEILSLIVLALGVFLSVISRHFIWRGVAIKISLDALAVSLLGFSGEASQGLRVISVLVTLVSAFLLFVYLVVGFNHFKTRRHEQSSS